MTEAALKSNPSYLKDKAGVDRTPNIKGMMTTNWKLINSATIEKIHFNIPKLEGLLGYASNNKNSVKIFEIVNSIATFDEKLFPQKLKDFLEFDKIAISVSTVVSSTATP